LHSKWALKDCGDEEEKKDFAVKKKKKKDYPARNANG